MEASYSVTLPTQIKLLIVEEKQKLKKLPPDRVGANFDHSSSTSAGWLPSFGRVWNNGRRWQSRYQPAQSQDLNLLPAVEIALFVLLSFRFFSGINSKRKLQQETNSSHIKEKH